MKRTISGSYLVLVRRFPSPSRTIPFSDVSWANGRETPGLGGNSHLRLDHVSRNALAARNNEAKGLGNSDKR